MHLQQLDEFIDWPRGVTYSKNGRFLHPMSGLCRPRRSIQVIAIHPHYRVDADLLRARFLTLAEPRAVSETLDVHLLDHRERSAIPFGLTLRQEPEMGDL